MVAVGAMSVAKRRRRPALATERARAGIEESALGERRGVVAIMQKPVLDHGGMMT